MEDLSFRSFGTSLSDLEIDFGQPSRPELVSAILEGCHTSNGNSGDDKFNFWEFTLGDRIAALMRIAASDNQQFFSMVFACRETDCGEQMEVDLSIQALLMLQEEASEAGTISASLGGRSLEFRKPTGEDQRTWLDQSFDDEVEASMALLRALQLAPLRQAELETITEVEFEQIDQSMREADPLVDFHVITYCPTCETEQRFAIDLQAHILKRLRETQHQLVRDIHRLALNYHWDERQVLSVPPRRRAYYLSLLEEEL